MAGRFQSELLGKGSLQKAMHQEFGRNRKALLDGPEKPSASLLGPFFLEALAICITTLISCWPVASRPKYSRRPRLSLHQISYRNSGPAEGPFELHW
jgi:hypothetical protein